jgi:hypothetical protein
MRPNSVSVFQVEPTHLGPIDIARVRRSDPERKNNYNYWDQLDRFCLKTETELSLRNVVFKQKTERWIVFRIVTVILKDFFSD